MSKSASSNGLVYFDCVKGLGFKSYVCQLCVIVLLLIVKDMYEYVIGIVNLCWFVCITKCELA